MEKNREIKAIFFDLDGTLLPREQDFFIKQYFNRIAGYLAPYGVDPKTLIGAILKGTEFMIKNDGNNSNETVFWKPFFEIMGEDKKYLIPLLDKFYFSDFKLLKEHTWENRLAIEAVKVAAKNGQKVVLATNPVFPMSAQLERISWLGLSQEDFELITSYENSCFCKPNPKYYLEICDKIRVLPENCLMIGNDERDDMQAAMAAGLDGFLVTDCVIKSDSFEWDAAKSGSFQNMLNMLKKM